MEGVSWANGLLASPKSNPSGRGIFEPSEGMLLVSNMALAKDVGTDLVFASGIPFL